MGGLFSRFLDPDDAYVGDMVFLSHYEERNLIPAFHGPLLDDFSTFPYCRTYFFRFGELPWDCDQHVYTSVHGGA